MSMGSGKLPPSILQQRVLSYLGTTRDDVIIRAALGEDATAVDFGDEACVLSADPITGADEDALWYAVHVAANDVAATGATPVGILLTILLPEDTTEQYVEQLMRQADKAANELGVEIVGGHTEVTAAVCQVVVCATAVGRAKKAELVSSGGAEPGDALIMTKSAGLEGTAILAADFKARVTDIIGADGCRAAAELKYQLSVVKEGMIAAKCGASAMHDVTEGGVLGAVYEMVSASKAGVRIDAYRIPVLPETKMICDEFGVDPLRLISSGCMLITARDGAGMCKQIVDAGIPATVIGGIAASSQGMYVVCGGEKTELCPPRGDELWRLRKRMSED